VCGGAGYAVVQVLVCRDGSAAIKVTYYLVLQTGDPRVK
jgi:hypothetical protein